MSTKKDAIKTSNSNKKVTTNVSTRREESTDRSNVKKKEKSQKTETKRTTTGLVEKKKDVSGAKTNAKVENTSKVQSTPHEKQVSTTIRRKVKPKVPVTPTSSRVSKTQYFPSKSLYSNALKVDEIANKSMSSNSDSREVKEKLLEKSKKDKEVKEKLLEKSKKDKEITKIRNKPKSLELRNRLSYNKEKKQIRDISPDSSSTSERPRTATLRKGSIVNANIVGPDVPKQLVSKTKIKEVLEIPSPKSEQSDEYNYEDDFESYESDFEEYFSSSSTNPNDISGEETSSISSNSSSTNMNLPRELKSSQKRASSAGTDDERKLDSGNFDMSEFKHKQVLDNIKESIEKENANLKIQDIQKNNPASLSDEGFEDQKSLQFINFLDAKKKCEHRKSMEMKRKRGAEILNMIRLDTYSFTLFDLAPVPYEVFIKNYGRSNTVQTSVQTGEDNIDEEIQTEEITNSCKWTQFPIAFSKIDPDDTNYWTIYKSNYLGVGGDVIVEKQIDHRSYNENNLVKFLLSAGDLISKIQLESNLEDNGKVEKNNREIPFSDGYVSFNTSIEILKDCSVKCFSFCSDNTKVLTVHSSKKQDLDYRSVVCVWTISNSEDPETFFITYGDVSCCSFGFDSTDLIYVGLNDGTISVWDLKKKIFNEDTLLKRTPLHTTEIGTGHTSKVVSLQPFTSHTKKVAYFQSNETNEICSLDDEGNIIIWSVVMKQNSNETSTKSCTTWNDVVLVKNTKISLKFVYTDLEDLQCTDFIVNTTDSNYVLVSTNYGFIMHYLVKGGKSNVKKFIPESASTANCLEVCPFSPMYFLAGFEDGNINLYSRLVEKPIMILSEKEESLKNNGIQIIQWSKSKPFLIYAKDVSNTIHIWDLNESDISPIYSIPFKDNIECLKLSSLITDGNEKKSYMLIGTEDGKLYLHLLSSDHGPQPHQTYKEQVNTFLKYVNRL